MHLIDWLLIALPVVLIGGIALSTQRHMRGVAEFMSGGRLAGRYMLTVAKSEMQSGAVVFVAAFELFARSGFVTQWWVTLTVLVNIYIAMSGFVIYRFRETRALTLAQFFEMRYSRGFRLFMGGLAFLAGIMNFGVIPVVGTRFFIYFLGLPTSLHVFGLVLPTEVLLMAAFLTLSVTITLAGGLITLMVADCLEGILSQVFFLVIVGSLVAMFQWGQIDEVLRAAPPGHSMLNPFDAFAVSDFNFWYVLMALCFGTYGTMAFQHASAYNAAARSPHETRIGAMLARLREQGKVSVAALLAVCAVTFLHHPAFAAQAAAAHRAIDAIADPQMKLQMQVPVALASLLPAGVKGALCVVLLMGVFGGDSTHLHSWGGIFVQDVVLPLRKRPLTPVQHVRLLRWAMAGVAAFAFLFGAFFRISDFINMWWQITMAIFVAGAGAAIIGGLYWRKGTTTGAWCGVIVGSVLAGTGIVLREIYGPRFPLNGTQVAFGASAIAIAAYLAGSLLSFRTEFDLEAMLHRPPRSTQSTAERSESWWWRLLGIDADFDRGDRWLAGGLMGWCLLWAGVTVIGSFWNLVAPWPEPVWSEFWKWTGFGMPLVLCAVIAIWFSWGGTRDLRAFFRALKTFRSDPKDNGAVSAPPVSSAENGDALGPRR